MSTVAGSRGRTRAHLPARIVSIANRHPRLRINRKAVARVIQLLDTNPAAIGVNPRGIPQGELSIAFLTNPEIARLHGLFMRNPTTTDVMTFEGDSPLGVAGEICVSADTAANYAEEHGRSFSAELTLYIVHGWLHLAGHDDLEPAKKRAMRRAESRAMRVIERAKAIPVFNLQGHQSAG